MSQSTPELLVLLGSGVSYSSNGPSVREITEDALSTGYYRHSDGWYYPLREQYPEEGAECASEVQAFLTELIGCIGSHFRDYGPKGLAPNYEHLLWLCKQIERAYRGFELNAPVGCLLRQLEPWVIARDVRNAHLRSLKNYADEGRTLINSCVYHLLRPIEQPTGFDLLSELADEHPLTIGTLNQDLLVENHFTNNGIAWSAGFNQPDGDVSWFTGREIPRREVPSVLKLHGSIDWWTMSNPRTNRGGLARLLGSDPFHARDKSQALLDYGTFPVTLSGGDKEIIYTRRVFSDLQYDFESALRRVRRVIVSGYGWSDQGITNRVANWLSRSTDNRVVLLHEDPSQIDRTPNALDNLGVSIQEYEQQGKVASYRKWLSDVNYSDLRHLL